MAERATGIESVGHDVHGSCGVLPPSHFQTTVCIRPNYIAREHATGDLMRAV